MDIFNMFDNMFGGHDYSIDDSQYHTEENIFGGEDIYEDGRLVASSHENIFGGEDYYDSENGIIATTKSNVFGGHDIYSEGYDYEGSTHAGQDGVYYTDSDGTSTFGVHETGNITTILGYSDPLSHVDSYIMPSMLV